MTSVGAIIDRLVSIRPSNLIGHKSRINSVGWSYDGAFLGTGSGDKSLKIWTVDPSGNTKEVHSFVGHAEGITQVTWSSSTNRVASCSGDKFVKIWDVDSRKCAHTVETKGDNINIAWSPKEQYLVVGNRSDILSVVDVRMQKVVVEKSFDYEVNEIAFDKTGKLLFAACGGGGIGKIEGFSLEDSGNLLDFKFQLRAHTANCYCVKIDRSGRYLATGGADALVSLWSLGDSCCVQTFPEVDYPLRTVGFSYDSRIIAYASEDSVIAFSNVETGDSLGEMDTLGATNSLDWHPKEFILAYAGDDKSRNMSTLKVVGVNFRG